MRRLTSLENFSKSIIWQCVRVVKESDSKSDRLACVGSNPTTVVFELCYDVSFMSLG